jgi:hypothetical protein
MKLLLPPDTTAPTKARWLLSVATTVRIEKERKASFTLKVPAALSFLPVKGK